MRKIGARSKDILHRDGLVMPFHTRAYELVVDHAEGSAVYHVDGSSYTDFAAADHNQGGN